MRTLKGLLREMGKPDTIEILDCDAEGERVALIYYPHQRRKHTHHFIEKHRANLRCEVCNKLLTPHSKTLRCNHHRVKAKKEVPMKR